jgi:hypothetical protein
LVFLLGILIFLLDMKKAASVTGTGGLGIARYDELGFARYLWPDAHRRGVMSYMGNPSFLIDWMAWTAISALAVRPQNVFAP